MKDVDFRPQPDRPAAPVPAESDWTPAISLERFIAAYDDWKAATVLFEKAVRGMHADEPGAREEAQDCARRLALLHHEFLEASQPHFAAGEHGTATESKSEPG